MFRTSQKLLLFLSFLLFAVVISIMPGVRSSLVSAAGLTQQSDVLSRLGAGLLASHQIRFMTPSGVQYNDTVTITFGNQTSSFSFGSFNLADYVLSVGNTTSCDTGTFAVLPFGPGGIAGAGVWGITLAGDPEVLTLTAPTGGSGQVAANRCLQLKIGSNVSGGSDVITNAVTPGVERINFAGTFGDTGFVDVPLVSQDTVTVTAQVIMHLTLNISDTDVEFGLATPTESRYATGGIGSGGRSFEIVAHTLSAETNNINGYTLSVSGKTMHTPTHSITTIGAAPALIAPGVEQFGIRLEANGGTGQVVYPYNLTAPSRYAYTGDIAPAKIAESLTPSGTTVYNVHYGASVDKFTSHGGYVSDFTYIATANL